MPWHSHRDRVAEVAAAFGIACGSLGKIGRDLTLLAQSEVAEAFEKPSGRGGSSSMPHKQNPVRAVTAVRCCDPRTGAGGELMRRCRTSTSAPPARGTPSGRRWRS